MSIPLNILTLKKELIVVCTQNMSLKTKAAKFPPIHVIFVCFLASSANLTLNDIQGRDTMEYKAL